MKTSCLISLVLCVTFQACGPLSLHTYLIPADTEPGWVTIEYSNPNCPPLEDGVLGRQFLIPKTRYLCTSTPMYEGRHRIKFFLVENHNQTPIREDEQIFRHGTSVWHEPSLDKELPDCDVEVEEFFYGPKEKLMLIPNNPIKQDEEFLKLHPGCRRSGTITESTKK
jgi:hypothetical protein